MINTLLQQNESKTLEFKQDLSSPRGVLKTLVAFANSAGGRLVLGVCDDKRIIGVADPLAEQVPSKHRTSIHQVTNKHPSSSQLFKGEINTQGCA